MRTVNPDIVIIQLLILAFCVVVGRYWLRLKVGESLLGAAIALPIPLISISPGAAGYVYMGDLVAVGFVALGLFSRIRAPKPMRQYRGVIGLAFLVLVALPLLSTLLGYMAYETARTHKFVGLGIARGIGYFVVFRYAINVFYRSKHSPKILALSCLAFAFFALLGIAHYFLGIKLVDVAPNRIAASGPDRIISAGYAGVYRGALGGWAVVMAAVASTLLLYRKFGALLAGGLIGLVFLVVFASGSRQGVVIGGMALCLGLFGSTRMMPPRARGRVIGRVALVVVLMMLGGLGAWTRMDKTRLKNYINNRYGELTDLSRAIEMAKERDPRYPLVWKNLTQNPTMLTVGIGYGTERTHAALGHSWIYIDSELFAVWQMGGIVLLGTYVVFAIVIRMKYRLFKKIPVPEDRTVVIAAIISLYGGVMLLWGHFYLLTTLSHQAAVAYYNWLLLGAALGITSKIPDTRMAQRSVRRKRRIARRAPSPVDSPLVGQSGPQ